MEQINRSITVVSLQMWQRVSYGSLNPVSIIVYSGIMSSPVFGRTGFQLEIGLDSMVSGLDPSGTSILLTTISKPLISRSYTAVLRCSQVEWMILCCGYRLPKVRLNSVVAVHSCIQSSDGTIHSSFSAVDNFYFLCSGCGWLRIQKATDYIYQLLSDARQVGEWQAIL